MSKLHTTHPGQSFRGPLGSLLWIAVSHIPWCDCEPILVRSQCISIGNLRFLLRVFSEFSGLCAIHKLVKKRRPQTKADLPLLHCQTFQHLQAMQQLNRSFRKAGMGVKANDDEHFWAFQLSILRSLSYLKEVHARFHNKQTGVQ